MNYHPQLSVEQDNLLALMVVSIIPGRLSQEDGLLGLQTEFKLSLRNIVSRCLKNENRI